MTALIPLNSPDGSFSTGATVVRTHWQTSSPCPHEFEAVACPEEEGGFSIFATHYPGVVSQGDDLAEARANIAEAFLAMLEATRKLEKRISFTPVPWIESTPNCVRLRISVDG